MSSLSLAAALRRAVELADGGARRIIGIAGAPGSGKSTVAEKLCRELGPRAAYLPMDGFHLANAELERLGLRASKGSIDTFDGSGYLALLRRVRASRSSTVYAPRFSREIEEPIAGSIAIQPEARLVVTEGNYLLIDREPWSAVPAECDETWYIEVDERTRLRQLIARHIEFGMDPDAATAWAHGTDQRNAELVFTSRSRADRVVHPNFEGTAPQREPQQTGRPG